MAESKVVELNDKDKMLIVHYPYKEEELSFNWKISNFSNLYTSAKSSESKEIASFPFTGGKSIGVLWNFEFLVTFDTEGRLGFDLKFLGSDPVGAGADYKMRIKTATEEAVFYGENWYPERGCVMEYEDYETLEELQEKGCLPNDELQMKLDITVKCDRSLISATEVQLQRALSWDLKDALETGLGADVSFVFVEENVKIKAHRWILSVRSPVFATMFGSGWKEATEGQVTIEDMSPKAFKILLGFIYSGEVDQDWGSVPEEMFYGAHRYELEGLLKYLCSNVDPVLTMENVMKIRNLAKLYNLFGVSNATRKFIEKDVGGFLAIHDVTLKNIN